ncbi:hypothetical protein AB9F26_19670 [Falsihalocynthiibacter sp. BN13B15]|uniref:hypothetical protein n=1 Tax=Falsihalocynthiibacter sp. BN13B15 TaxID=3240871 RepID=UPI00350FB76C
MTSSAGWKKNLTPCGSADQRLNIYSIEDQCRDFFEIAFPYINTGTGSWRARAKEFMRTFEESRKSLQLGKGCHFMESDVVQDLDHFYSRQPRQLKSMPME